MSLDTRKPVFGVCDQIKLKPAFSASEISQGLEISDIETRDIIYESQIWTSYFLVLSSNFLVLTSYFLVLTSYFLILTS